MMSRPVPGSAYDRFMRTSGLLLCAFLISCSASGGGDEFCDGSDCVCPPGADCVIDCPGGGDCDVQASTGSTVDVDCGDSLTCDVECSSADQCDVACNDGDCDVTCPADGCTVTGCGSGCDVLCGLGSLPTMNGTTATCP